MVDTPVPALMAVITVYDVRGARVEGLGPLPSNPDQSTPFQGPFQALAGCSPSGLSRSVPRPAASRSQAGSARDLPQSPATCGWLQNSRPADVARFALVRRHWA